MHAREGATRSARANPDRQAGLIRAHHGRASSPGRGSALRARSLDVEIASRTPRANTREPDQRQLKGRGGADFDNPLRRVRAGELSSTPFRRPRSTCAHGPPAPTRFHFAFCILQNSPLTTFESRLPSALRIPAPNSSAAPVLPNKALTIRAPNWQTGGVVRSVRLAHVSGAEECRWSSPPGLVPSSSRAG